MIPAFPSDATILSIYLVNTRGGGAAFLKEFATKLTTAHRGLRVSLGHEASSFVKEFLANKIDATELVERHSHFCHLSSTFSEEDVSPTLAALVSGDDHRLRRRNSSLMRSLLGLRLCPECVREDVERFGTGHWRVLHQLTILRFCTVHKHRLHDRCADCGAVFDDSKKLFLPGDPCRQCGSKTTSSGLSGLLSPGYSALEDLITRARFGNAPELRPRATDRLLKKLFCSEGSKPNNVLDEFLDWWGVIDMSQLAELLPFPMNSGTVPLLLKGHITPRYPLAYAVVPFAWERSSEADRKWCLAKPDDD